MCAFGNKRVRVRVLRQNMRDQVCAEESCAQSARKLETDREENCEVLYLRRNFSSFVSRLIHSESSLEELIVLKTEI